ITSRQSMKRYSSRCRSTRGLPSHRRQPRSFERGGSRRIRRGGAALRLRPGWCGFPIRALVGQIACTPGDVQPCIGDPVAPTRNDAGLRPGLTRAGDFVPSPPRYPLDAWLTHLRAEKEAAQRAVAEARSHLEQERRRLDDVLRRHDELRAEHRRWEEELEAGMRAGRWTVV